jgi:hypothetical protein
VVQLLGCTYVNGFYCYLDCEDGTRAEFDVHSPQDETPYYPSNWGVHMLEHRDITHPNPKESEGLGGVFRPNDVDYFYSLLYHITYHTRADGRPRTVTDEYAALLVPLATRIGAAGWSSANIRDLGFVKAQVDQFLRCRGYSVQSPLFDPQGPFNRTQPACVQAF